MQVTPVYIASYNGHVEIVRELHKLGADVNTPEVRECVPDLIETHENVVWVVLLD